MTEKLICAGTGGQGVQTLGQIIAILAMRRDKQVTWMPSYGAEMRGGTSNCTIVASDAYVASPIVEDGLTTLVAMNNPSLDKFLPKVAKGGRVLLNSSMVTKAVEGGYHVLAVDANTLAGRAGNPQGQNMVMLGAYLGLTGFFSMEEVEAVFQEKFKGKAQVITKNLVCVRLGMEEAARLGQSVAQDQE